MQKSLTPLFMLCILAIGAAPATQPALKTYTFAKQKFKVQAPASWPEMPSKRERTVLRLRPDVKVAANEFPDVLIFDVAPLTTDDGKSLDELAKDAQAGHENAARISAVEDIKIDGEPAKRYTVDEKLDTTDTHAVCVIMHRNHQLYLITYFCTPARSQAASAALESVLKTFKWT